MSATAIFPSADPVGPLLSGKNGTAASTDEEQAFAALLGGGSVSDIVLASLARQATPDTRLQDSGIADRPLDPVAPQRDIPTQPTESQDQSRPPQQTNANRQSPEDSAPPPSSEAAAIGSSSNRAAPDEQKSTRTAPTPQSNAPADQPATAQPRAAAAAAQPQTPAGQNPALRAQVTDAPVELVSQPANTLTANAAVVAQKASDNRGANTAAAEPTASLAAQNAQQRALGNGQDPRTPGKPGGDAAAAKAAAQNSQPAQSSAVPATDAFNAMLATQAAATPQPATANSFARAEQAVLASNGSTGQPVARQASSPAPVQPPKPPVPPRPVTNQVAVQIQKAAAQGSDRINIQLKPAELGRVEVQMDVAKDGRVTAVISAERSETLDMLQRDARALQSALNDAGLKTDSDSLSFNLKGQNQAQGEDEQSAGQANGDGLLGDETDGADGNGPTARQDIVTNDRVDIEV